MSTHPPETEGKPFNPAAVGAMAGVNITDGTIGGAVVGLPTVVGTGQLTGGIYTVTATDCRLQVTATASVAVEVDLRAGTAGAEIRITNSGGDPATAKQVTPKPAGNDTILGQAWDADNPPLVIQGRESYLFAYNATTADWEVL